jgi:hypothetical protein
MMTKKVNGTTSPINTAAISHPELPLISHTATPHTRLTKVARCPLRSGSARVEGETRWLLGNVDIESSARKKCGGQYGD